MRFAPFAAILFVLLVLGLGVLGTTIAYRRAEQARAQARMMMQQQMQAKALAAQARGAQKMKLQEGKPISPEAVEELLAATDSSEEIRVRALLRLGSTLPPDRTEAIARGLRDDSPVVRALAAILVEPAAATEEVMARLGDALADPQLSAAASYALRRLGPAAASEVPELIELLEMKDPVRREQAARTLAAIGPGASAAIPALTRALDDLDQAVRHAAADALKRISGSDER